MKRTKKRDTIMAEMCRRLELADAKAYCFERSFRDIYWMARRYADGRRTYAPSMYNEAVDRVSKWVPHLMPDSTATPPSIYAQDGDFGEWNSDLGRFVDKPKPRNRAKCGKCGDIIESKTRHDFVKCKCGAIFLDGGLDYCRRGGDPMAFVEVVDE